MIETIDLDRHVVIDASAGTGKTYAIEHLVLRLLVERKVPLRQILVVTFTEKATGELKERLRRAVEAELEFPRRQDAVPLLREALDAFDDAPIHTIHAFCHRVLSRFAFENAHPFSSPVVDDVPLREKRLRELMRKRFGMTDTDRLLELLKAADFPELNEQGESGWERSVRSLAASYRPYGGDRVLPEVADLLAADDAALAAIRDARDRVLKLVGPINSADPAASAFAVAYGKLNINATTRKSRVNKVVVPTLRFLHAHRAQYEPAAFVGAFLELLEECGFYSTFKREGHFAVLGTLNFNKGKDNPAACPAAVDVAEQLDAIHRQIEGRVANLAVFAATRLQEDVTEFKRERGQISYDDMIRRLEASLDPTRSPTNAPLLTAALRKRYRYALVDEFQDTDPLQWSVFRRLFVDSMDGHRLAVVGDPKQAIYGFRNADLGAYLQAVKQLTEKCGAKRYPLDVNWRSMPEMIDALNAMFDQGGWFDGPAGGGGGGDTLKYVPIKAPKAGQRRARLFADASGRHPITAVMLPGDPKPTVKDGFPRYARFIAREVRRLLSRGDAGSPVMEISDAQGNPVALAPNHICILVQRKKEVPRLEKALRALGVKCTWYKKPGLWQSDEALHLSHVLRAIAEPGDSAATRKALLTRFFHVTGADGGYGRIGPDRIHRYEGLPPSHPVRRTLQRWQELAAAREWPCLFREMLQGTGLLLDETLEPDGDRRVANHLQIAEQLQSEAIEGGLDVHRLLARLEGYRKELLDADEDANVHRLETSDPRVLILTMHTAKGLEFPVVFVAGGLTDPRAGDFLKYHDDAGRVVYDLRPNSPEQARDELERESELRRVYYVACTRAMHKLYIPYFRDEKGRYAGGLGLSVMSRAADAGEPTGLIGRAATDDADGPPAAPWKPALDPRPVAAGAAPAAVPVPVTLPPTDQLFPSLPGPFFGRVLSIASFSSLAEAAAPPLAPPVIVEDDDRLEEESAWDEDDEPETTGEAEAEVDNGFALPGGKKTGTLVHELLEHVDFAAVKSAGAAADLLDGETGRLIDERLLRHFPAAARGAELWKTYRLSCATLLFNVLRAPLPEVGRLCDVPPSDRLTELEFHFPLGDLNPAGVDLPPPPEVYVAAGYLTGKVDLVFRAGGRCYLLDWKTNTLTEGYGAAAMSAAMAEARYDLQRAIYAVAVTRMLGVTAQPAQFGGAFYLFLRGIGDPASGGAGGAGVCFADARVIRGAKGAEAC